MLDGQTFLKNLALVLSVAGVTTVIFDRLRLPVVLGYVLAGLIIGPHIPVPLVADLRIVQTLSELGVILLMFSIGLEFSLRKLVRIGKTAGLIMVIEVSLMLWLGYVVGRMFGWSFKEAIFTGAIVAISSTMIVAKSFSTEHRDQKLYDIVFGVLVFEDLAAVLLLAALTALSMGSLSTATLFRTAGRLGLFLLGLVVVGLMLVPRTIRLVARQKNKETLLCASVGFCFALALFAEWLGYSVALGAFIAGTLVAESGEASKIEHAVRPLRDIFGAVFFVSVGMLIDPKLLVHHIPAGLVLTALVIIGKLTGVSLGAFLTGHGIRTSIQAGMRLAQIGEFSFIIAGVGLQQQATGDFLYPLAVAVSAVTALGTPWLSRASLPVATYIDRRLPRPLQTLAALYGSWVENLRSEPGNRPSPSRRLIRLLLLDALLLVGIVIATSVSFEQLTLLLQAALTVPQKWARILVLVISALVALPFLLGILRISSRLGDALAARVIPPGRAGQADLGSAPRLALSLMLRLLIVLLVGVPLMAATQPFLPSVPGAVLLGILLLICAVALWHSATNLLGHVRSGTQAIIETLVEQSQSPSAKDSSTSLKGASPSHFDAEELKRLLPGFGSFTLVAVEAESPCIGRTLGQLNLRGLTGATVLAIKRGSEAISNPLASEMVQAGDILVLLGSDEAVARARRMLKSGAPE